MNRNLFIALLCLALPAIRLHAAELPPAATQKIDFTRDVKPLLAKYCIECHGEKKQESGLRLDRRSHALRGGDLGKVIVSEKSAESRLIQFVAAIDPDHVMPPEGPRLTAEQVGVLRAWIDQGTIWPDEAGTEAKVEHWAYQPIRRPTIPTVQHATWAKSPIDVFVLAQQEKRKLEPSPQADRTTLIRRLSLDLTGLLPSLAEVDEFLNDTHSDAYERLVDRLLASKHFGERWGRHWLDMARYADSDGYEKDNPRPDAYRWRDWVIDAINADLPFDQFTVEQLAGDLIPNATAMQKLATAFHRQTLTNTEGGTDQEQFRVEACFDRTETTGAVWLGLTVGCARCHSHKYDAISQREYYQLFSVFNNGDEQTTVVPKSDADVAAYATAKAAHDAAVANLVAKLQAEQSKLGPAIEAWEQKIQAQRARLAASPLKLHGIEQLQVTSDGAIQFAVQKDGSILASGENPERANYTATGRVTLKAPLTAVRIDALPDPSLPAKGPGRVSHGNFVLSEVQCEIASKPDFSDVKKVDFTSAQADHEQNDKSWPAQHVIDGKPETGWAIGPHFGKEHWIVLSLKEPVSTAAEQPLFVRLQLSQQYGKQHTLGRFKLSLQTGTEPAIALPEPIAKVLDVAVERRTAEQRQQLVEHVSTLENSTKALLGQLDELKKKEPAKPELNVRVLVQRAKDPRKTYVLKRGEFLTPLKDLEVTPAGLSTLPEMKPRQANAAADRLDLANWLVHPENPLTPRVTVNHMWRLLFGNGIVRTPNDFGVRGERPSHPELLDWLAAEFVNPTFKIGATQTTARQWSRKGFLKLILMSATYQQASAQREHVREIDPQNVWLTRQNRLRVEGEIVRDISLDVAGLLSRKVGGPSVFPPLPPGIAELSYAGNFKWNDSKGEDRYRRGMYTFFKRTAPHPNLTTFDCPDANLTCVERRASNTPLQALTSLNNEQFSETARALARRVLSEGKTTPTSEGAQTDEALLTHAFRLCVSRRPNSAELHELTALLSAARNWYREHPESAKSLVGADAASGTKLEENASWFATTRILLNLDEFITRE